jgi:hypothetical protein
MSLFGKILALLNIFGAIAVIYFASSVYSKRKAWAYSKLRHDLVLRGLPLDEQEEESNQEFIVKLLGHPTEDATLNAIFQQAGGNPVPTQIAEVQRVKGQLDSKISGETTPRGKTYLLSRILLPLADQHVEREQLLACQSWLANDADLAKFKDRYVKAFAEAVREVSAPPAPGGPTPRTFEEAFRSAVRAQGGPRSEAFTTMIVKRVPGDPSKVDIAREFDAVFDEQHKQLQKSYDDHFAAALVGDPAAQRAEKQLPSKPNAPPAARTAVEMQKAAIARLLLGLSLYQAEENAPAALKALNRDSADFGMRLADSETYRNLVKRMLVVCGLRGGLDAIAEQSMVQRQLLEYLAGTIQEERGQFVGDHSYYVEVLRKHAALVKAEEALRDESKRKLASQEETVRKRQKEVDDYQGELKELEKRTDESMKELRKISEDLLKQRTDARDMINKAQESEKTIRELEMRILELERKKQR